MPPNQHEATAADVGYSFYLRCHRDSGQLSALHVKWQEVLAPLLSDILSPISPAAPRLAFSFPLSAAEV